MFLMYNLHLLFHKTFVMHQVLVERSETFSSISGIMMAKIKHKKNTIQFAYFFSKLSIFFPKANRSSTTSKFH